jgi:hypothetical protein
VIQVSGYRLQEPMLFVFALKGRNKVEQGKALFTKKPYKY